MAELADALDSGSSESNFMQVQVLFPAPEKPAFDSVRRRAFCISVFLQVSAYMISSLSDLLRQVTGDHRLHTVLTVILHGLIVVPACVSQHIQHPDHMVDLGLNARFAFQRALSAGDR